MTNISTQYLLLNKPQKAKKQKPPELDINRNTAHARYDIENSFNNGLRTIQSYPLFE